MVQTTDWAQTVRHPAPGDGYCGDLSASSTTKFGVKNLSDFGANSKGLKGSGKGTASWHVKLARIP